MKFNTDTESQNKANNRRASAPTEWVPPECLQWMGNHTIYTS